VSVQQLRDSAAFAAGAMHERRRIGELLRQRGRDLEQLGSMGLPLSTVRMLTSEVQLLINAIEQGI
jgi:hypothetical protein